MTTGDWALVFVVAVGAFVMGGFAGSDFTDWRMRAEAVEHGCASYDPQTGKWGWKP